jgi:hypothetical protein
MIRVNGKLAITPGKWRITSADGNLPEGRIRCSIYKEQGTARIISVHAPVENDACANAELIAEAGTVTNETGRTPAELRDLCRELRAALQNVVKLDDAMNDPENEDSGTTTGAYYAYYKGEHDTWESARAALAKSEGI